MPASKASNAVSREVFLHVKEAKSPLRPTRLLEDLVPTHSYAAVQDAISELLESQKIALTPDRHLIVRIKGKLPSA